MNIIKWGGSSDNYYFKLEQFGIVIKYGKGSFQRSGSGFKGHMVYFDSEIPFTSVPFLVLGFGDSSTWDWMFKYEKLSTDSFQVGSYPNSNASYSATIYYNYIAIGAY